MGKARHVTRLFGAQIAAQRKAKGMTQKALVETLGISQESLCRMEKGLIAPRFERLFDFARALDCSIAGLFAEPKSKPDKADPAPTEAPASAPASALASQPALASMLSSLPPDTQRDVLWISWYAKSHWQCPQQNPEAL